MQFGAQVLAVGGTRFRLWAPAARQAEVVLEPGGAHAMQVLADGWHEAVVPGAGAGSRYRYRLDGGTPVPDPASRYNPDDVHGASEVVDPAAYAWQDAGWRGRPWHEAVVYELHVGCFTPEGSFAAAAERLAELAALGVTAIQLMPLADTPGARNWGYDGVLMFAPEAGYGRPDDLRALVDRAHALGLMVFVDVVYNHFGPDGNYLHGYCPQFFNAAHQTPWGAAINYDGEHKAAVRAFFVANALYWVEEFHCDGLRLDAVHQIRDDSALAIVEEIAQALAQGPGRQRHVHLVLENERNQAQRLAPAGLATAQWNDDLHNAAHVLLTGETDGYYADYAQAPHELFARALAEGYAYQGQVSPHLGEPRGEPSGQLPPTAFVSFLQNHDQVGNRAMGERLDRLVGAQRLEALYACLLLAPHIPMLFMGEEFAASTPFLFFCDFEGELADAVRNGRRAEFKRFAVFADEAARARIPDPNAEATFAQSKLRWAERETTPHRERLALVGRLLALRHQHLVPRLAGAAQGGRSLGAGRFVRVAWPLANGARWELQANLQDAAVPAPLAVSEGGQPIYVSHAGTGMPPWSVRVSLHTP
ncbi:malto-oligosyltrehalose trehalohydrolase [Pseudorhodoferax sp. Leaf274]|uniref:malto-oligosyltrehalose trehalohydrolase n=1 Tax=Pseudorhodoferax sp. Leaf274 TaxID=1736318 RepID=UPI000702DA3C|nr:malto-oligosyltrehalose trehalohydrolase [Pseudorhodoferax sp. Leaf274]KQP36281.1 malto-oligosyltrehalose trehalohydrolase [Pseudorhodoferax sp. Leaf274]